MAPVAHEARLSGLQGWVQKGPQPCLPLAYLGEVPGLGRGHTLPVADSQLCGRVELLQGQTLGQDVSLSVRARVQLGSEQRERGGWARDHLPTSKSHSRGQGRKDGGPGTTLLHCPSVSSAVRMELIADTVRVALVQG